LSDKVLKLGIPKGSLQKATFDLFERAGFNVTGFERSYFPRIDDTEIQLIMLRCELQYSKATSRPTRWVLAVPNESSIEKAEDLEGGIIATELVNATKRFFEEKNVNVKVEFSWGATEVKARLVDGIVELTETGSSIKANNLKIIDTLMTSTTRFIANNGAWADDFKKQKIESIAMLLNAAIDAKTLVGLKMNIQKDNLNAILDLLPAEKSPTVAPLADDQYVAIEIIISEKDGRELIPKLKRAGASGIFTYSLNNVIH
jgi:ATP phosphoribosyltransferase